MLIGKKLKRLLLAFLIVALAFSPIVGQENLFVAKASEEVTTNELNESASLSEKIQAILSDKRLDGAIAGVSVRNEIGEELFEQDGDIRLHPASNMKLLTSAAALTTLEKIINLRQKY